MALNSCHILRLPCPSLTSHRSPHLGIQRGWSRAGPCNPPHSSTRRPGCILPLPPSFGWKLGMGDRHRGRAMHRAPNRTFLLPHTSFAGYDLAGVPWKEPKFRSQIDVGLNPKQQCYSFISPSLSFLKKLGLIKSLGKVVERMKADCAYEWHILGALVADRLYSGPNNPHLYHLAPLLPRSYLLSPLLSSLYYRHTALFPVLSARQAPASGPLRWLLLLPKLYFLYPHD